MSRAAFLIDADNLSLEGIEEAFGRLEAMGLRLSLRRAYGSHDTLGTLKEFLGRNGVRAIINQGKGTTDAALVVDAMDLLYADSLPGVVAIGSGDADFAPLVVRLREAGLRTVCFAQAQKAGEGLERVYDEVIHVGAPAAAKRRAPAKKAARAPAKAAAPVVEANPVRSILDSFPGFAKGQEIELNAVVKKLRDEKLMSKSTSARNFFKKHAPEVELVPDRQPNRLRLGAGL